MPKKQEPPKVPFRDISGKKLYSAVRNKIIKSKEFGKSEELEELVKNMPASAKVGSIINASKKKEHNLSYQNKQRLKEAIIGHFSKACRNERMKNIKERNVHRSIYEREEEAQGGVSGGTGMIGGSQNIQAGLVGRQQGGSVSIMSSRMSGEKRVSRASVGGKTKLGMAGGMGAPGSSGPAKSPSLNKPSLRF